MKTISVLLSLLLILSIWISLMAPSVDAIGERIITKVTGDLAKNLAAKETQAGLGNTTPSSPTPVSGGDSSKPSNNGQKGSDHQIGSNQEQTGQVIWTVPITTYPNTYPSLGNTNLWIDTSQGRMQYAAVPQYSHVSLIASTLLGGQGLVYELYPITIGQDAYTTSIYSLSPGDNQLGFVAKIVGRHILFFSINNQASNVVIIDVQGSIPQQSNGGLLGQGVGA